MSRHASEEVLAKRLARLGNATRATESATSNQQANGSKEVKQSEKLDTVSNQSIPSMTGHVKAGEGEDKTQPMHLDTVVHNDKHEQNTHPRRMRPPEKPMEEQAHELICHLLHVSLLQSKDQSSVVLTDLASELSEEKGQAVDQILLTVEDIDRVLVASLAASRVQTPFNYVLSCYSRAVDSTGRLPAGSAGAVVCAKARELLISYSGILLQFPEIFTSDQSINDDKAAQLLDPLFSTNELPPTFMADFIQRFHNDENASKLFPPLLKGIEKRMRGVTLVDNFVVPLQIMAELCSFKALVPHIINLDNWLPNTNDPLDFEAQAFLAAFFLPSSFPDDNDAVAKLYFEKPTERTQRDVESNQESLRRILEHMQKLQFQLVRSLLSVSEARDSVLAFVAKALSLNHKRAQMHRAQNMRVSTNAFLINLTTCLLSLCEPFMGSKSDKLFSKMTCIDYFSAPSSRMPLVAETRLCATEQEAKEYMSEIGETEYSKPHFVVEVFFLTLYALHVGYLKSCQTHEDMHKELREMQTYYQELKRTQPQWSQTPDRLHNEALLARITAAIELTIRNKLAYDVQLLDARLLDEILSFARLAAVWLLRLIDPQNTGVAIDPPSRSIVMLPEFLVADLGQFLLYLTKFSFRTLDVGPLDEIVALMVELIGNPHYIKNPYLRASFVEVMYMMTPEVRGGKTQFMWTVEQNPIARHSLVPVLRNFWSEVQSTGANTQFYDKFTIRYHIAVILKEIWEVPEYRDKMVEESRDTEGYVKFVNHLMADTTYLLDESLQLLAQLRDIEQLKRRPEEWKNLTPQERQEKERTYQQSSRTCKSLHMLANETVSMFHYLTEAIVAPFLRPELVDRLAAMLDYHLDQLAGPQCQNLKVEHPELYHFEPRVLLGKLTDIYTNLLFPADQPPPTIEHPLIKAMAKDERSFKPKVFLNAANILRKRELRSEERLQQLEQAIKLVEECKAAGKVEEEELGDVPDDFIDPLMCTLMTDPVVLPTSNKIVDRKTIETHLLSDGFDPFNRAPLSADQLIPATDMKARIDDWLAQQKGQKR